MTRGVRNRIGLAVVDAGSGAVTEVAPGGVRGAPQWTADGAIAATYEDHATPPAAAARHPRRRAGPAAHPVPARGPQRAARRAGGRRRSRHATGSRSRPCCSARATRRPSGPCPRSSIPHGGPTDAYQRRLGRPRCSTSSTRATPGSRSTSAAPPATAASSSGRTTTCGASRTRGTASPRPTTCGRSTGSTATGWGSSARATARTCRCSSVTDDPEHRFRCACAKYGDCDIVTSWAQGDREGVQDLERMMGPPSSNRAAYRAGSPDPPARADRGAAADRARRARRARQPAPVGGAGRRPAPLGQDLRVRDVPDGGPRTAARRTAAALLPPARALPRLVSNVTVSMDEIVQSVTRREPSNGE